MKKFLLSVCSICFVVCMFVEKSYSAGFEWAEAWCIDTQKNARELDPTTGRWHIRASNVKAVEGSYYENYDFEATFIINLDGQILQYVEGQWTRRYGCALAKDIGSYDINSTYVILETDGQIFKYNTNWNGFDWHSSIEGESLRAIDVDTYGIPWVVTESGNLYRYNGVKWVLKHEAGQDSFYASDIGANADKVYVVGYHDVAGAPKLYEYDGNGFNAILNGATKVDVNRDGDIYVVMEQDFSLWVKFSHAANFTRIQRLTSAIDVGM